MRQLMFENSAIYRFHYVLETVFFFGGGIRDCSHWFWAVFTGGVLLFE